MVCNDCDNNKCLCSSRKKCDDNGNDILKNKDRNNFLFDLFDIDKYINKIIYNMNACNSCSKNLKPFFKKTQLFIVFSILIVIIVWACSGLYTIKEAERGVILRFGQYHCLVHPGLNWKPTFVDVVIPVNVKSVRELAASGMMLTSDENVIRVEMNVQYRVTDPKNYLFNVTNADDSLRQATDSALRGVIGKYNMDRILTEGRTVVRSDTRRILEKTIQPYNMGISLLDVNFQTARPPEEVKAAFDDAIAARENEQQYIREAEAYANEIQPKANGKAQRILEEGRAYKARTILEARGEVQRFLKVLPEYRVAPEITRERLYINSMERIFSNTRKIFIDSKNTQNVLLFSSDQIFSNRSSGSVDENAGINIINTDKKEKSNSAKNEKNFADNINKKRSGGSNSVVYDASSSYAANKIIKEEGWDQRRSNTQRADIIRKGRGD
ncbi:HflK protein [Candidatus Blochmanniella floridana]|uniref:Protein HflK n=1 Tax=Blochmanniella floridana TaxID=203907 RepID=Q7VQP3_BLOFL|nr:HflK protein [Candidatus Blochmannia floridanus]